MGGEAKRRKALHPELYGTSNCPGSGARSVPAEMPHPRRMRIRLPSGEVVVAGGNGKPFFRARNEVKRVMRELRAALPPGVKPNRETLERAAMFKLAQDSQVHRGRTVESLTGSGLSVAELGRMAQKILDLQGDE